MAELTIGQAARAAEVNIETIRYYERRGLIAQPPTPSDGGPRRYGTAAVRCLRFIKDAQRIGFYLGEIAELLSLRARADASCGEVRDLAVQKRLEVQDRLERLQRIADVLDELIADCPGNGDLGACSIHEAIERAK
ncbi:MAG: MerR family transcriptional regulator [Rhodobacteraceae bacterium]|nr:MerR family transcriptional regulator [Paracoccaceae bacterium]